MKTKIKINPFTQQIEITCSKANDIMIIETSYEEIDEWGCFEVFGIKYDYHLHYDSGLSFSIYKVIDNKIDYSKSVKRSLKVIY